MEMDKNLCIITDIDTIQHKYNNFLICSACFQWILASRQLKLPIDSLEV